MTARHDIEETRGMVEAIGLVRVALGLELTSDLDIPSDATFTVRRDVEYLVSDNDWWREAVYDIDVSDEAKAEKLVSDDYWCESAYAAPNGHGWQISGHDEVIESDWVGSDQMVRAYRWDLAGITLAELANLADLNYWESDSAEMLAGYLDYDGMHPACSIMADAMDWNMGGWTPVFIAVDYVILD